MIATFMPMYFVSMIFDPVDPPVLISRHTLSNWRSTRYFILFLKASLVCVEGGLQEKNDQKIHNGSENSEHQKK